LAFQRLSQSRLDRLAELGEFLGRFVTAKASGVKREWIIQLPATDRRNNTLPVKASSRFN
jgi:hypothetical protein